MRRGFLLAAVAALLALGGSPALAEPPAGFQDWSPATFGQARREQRIVLLMVSTSWCHWCHVMKRETYGDARVRAVLARRFMPIYVDADARPDLAERFRRYRWPTTAFLTPEGEPILALRGYRGPDDLLQILARVQSLVAGGGPYPGFADPNADVATSRPPADLDALIRALAAQLDSTFDERMAGWGTPQKYPLADPVLDGLERGSADPLAGAVGLERSLRTLEAWRSLIDPVAGGMYQYSLEGRWDRWHPEKIVPVNAGALHAYAEAYALTGDQRWADAGTRLVTWMLGTLRQAGGAFGASQDADAPGLAGERYHRLDAAARAPYGVPRVDGSVYASENGQLVEALTHWALATGSDDALEAAEAAATRILSTHVRGDGEVLTHAASGDPRRLFLVDYADFGRGLVALATARGWETPEGARWVKAAEALAKGMDAQLADPGSGAWSDATTLRSDTGFFAQRRSSLDGVARAVRFRLRLRPTADEREVCLRALRAVADTRAVEEHGFHGAGALRAARSLSNLARGPLLHAAVRSDAPERAALLRELRLVALRDPRVRIDPPSTGGPVVTLCTDTTCLEVDDLAALRRTLVQLLGPGSPR